MAHAALGGNKRNFACDIENAEKYYQEIEGLLTDQRLKKLPQKVPIKELKRYRN